MENKIKNIFLTIILLIIPAFIWAQTQNYYIQDTADGATFIQTFRWEANPYVQKYVFIIEKLNKRNKWEQIDKKETETNSVEESLTAGEYRYKLELYNFLGYVELETEWQAVSITKAYQPKISSVSPRTVFLEEQQDGIFTIDGEELSEDTTIVIQAGTNILDGKIIQTSRRKNSIKFQVNPDDLDTGKYTITAKNPGGLTDVNKDLRIQFKKPTDFDFAGGYSPILILGDSNFKKYFESTVYPIAIDLKMTFIPLKKKFGYYGFNFSNTILFLNTDNTAYSIKAGMLMSHIDFVFQKPLLNKKMFLEFHVGGGITTILNMQFEFPLNIKSDSLYSMNPCVAAGGSMLFYLNKRLYLEAGIDYNFTINIAEKPLMIHSIVPVINIGWQF